jgi:acyl-CoA dehydrogenase
LPVGQISPVRHACAAQHCRDGRITAIYDGTNGIQSIDLLMRKLAANGGASVWALLDELKAIGGGVPPINHSPPHGGSQRPDISAGAVSIS